MPSCGAMARKIAARDSKPERCLPLIALPRFEDNLQRIKRLLHEGVEVGAKGTVVNEDTGVTYIHPCITDAAKVAAEARFHSDEESDADLKYGFYDPLQLCAILNTTKLFHEIRCSPKLGIGKFNVNGKRVLVYKDGRINIRQARDKEDVLQTIRHVSRSLWGAIICTCGNTAVDCASGGCPECQTQICPVMSGGPPDPTEIRQKPKQKITFSAWFENVEALETGKHFLEGMEKIDEAFDLFKRMNLKFFEKHVVSSLFLKMEAKMVQAYRLAMQFILRTSDVYDASVGLVLSGLAMDLSRIIDGLKSLSFMKNDFSSPILAQLFSEAVTMANEAYGRFRECDFEGAKRIAKDYGKFRKTWIKTFQEIPQKELLIAVEKIGVNGFYISRLLTKPLPKS
jgi:hypothetical protein